MADWRRRLGPAYKAFSGLLVPLAGVTARTYPDPQSGLPLIVRPSRNGTFSARPPKDKPSGIDELSGLKATDVDAYRLDWSLLLPLIGDGLSISAPQSPTTPGLPWALPLGVHQQTGAVLPALLLVSSSSNEILVWLRALVARDQSVFVVPAHDPLVEDSVVRRSHRYIALDRDTVLQPRGKDWSVTLRAAAAPEAPLKGVHYTIDPSFRMVTDHRKRASLRLTNPSAIEALRCLAARRAFARDTAIPKKQLCSAVWAAIRHPKARHTAYQPIQFFRIKRDGKTVPLPIWGTLVQHDSRGYYWLAL